MGNIKRVLIDRNTLVGKDGLFSKRGCPGNCQHCGLWTEEGCRVILEAQPVDAVEVVRCKDCEYWKEFDGFKNCRNINGLDAAWADSFCSYGERKQNEKL